MRTDGTGLSDSTHIGLRKKHSAIRHGICSSLHQHVIVFLNRPTFLNGRIIILVLANNSLCRAANAFRLQHADRSLIRLFLLNGRIACSFDVAGVHCGKADQNY
eukprot:gnl/TRDRNA2_/TRDRNA2_37138_c0_seq1.p1 gnl/TRDRNA2_/TRDRNA2_37138_c0~~gnl/TRDRNA2_/TRDRNA2_37138_c0_seq1.p1  ORF type:complete len:104 (+),score=4.76 gnl/TRDRNA2_/TRDRNA2_37138_c0_seq1:3-314(+)